MARSKLPRIAALSGVAMLLVACSAAPPPPAEPAADTVAHDFTLRGVHGEAVSLSDWSGQVRLIDFWATWCAPCREEIPWLKQLQETYGGAGFTILAISDENVDIIREFVEQNRIDYPNLVDPGEVSREYGVISLPTAFLVDRDGNVVEEFRGVKPRRILEGKVRELLDMPPLS